VKSLAAATPTTPLEEKNVINWACSFLPFGREEACFAVGLTPYFPCGEGIEDMRLS